MSKTKKIKKLKKQISNLEKRVEYSDRWGENIWDYSAKQSDAIRNLFDAVRLVAEASKYQL